MALKILRTPLTLARKQGYITHNPSEAVEILPAEVSEKGVFTSKQVASLVKQAKGDWKGLILAGCHRNPQTRTTQEPCQPIHR